MLKKFALALLTVLLASPGARAEEGDCFSFDIVNNVKLTLRDKILNNRPGLTSRPYRLDIKTVYKKCGAFRKIVWTNDITIFLSNKLGDCQRRQVMIHEKKHVGSYIKAYRDIPPWVNLYLRTWGKGASEKQIYTDIYARLLTLQQRITKANRKFDWEQYKNPKTTHYLIKTCGSIWGE